MCAVAPVARPLGAGVPRRAAPVRSDAAAGARAFETKKPRGAAPAARGVMMARDSSVCLAGAGGFYVTKKEIVNGVEVEVELIPVGREKPVDPATARLRGVLARDPSVCLAAVEVFSVPMRKRTRRTRNNVEAEAEDLTVGDEMPVDPALDLLHKRMATELEALRELLKKAELISRGSACKSGAAHAGKSKRLLHAEPRSEPQVEAGRKTPSVKRRKISPLLEKKQTKVQRISLAEREQLAGRLTSLEELPAHIVEFLQRQFGDEADPHGEIEIDIHKVEDCVLFELKMRLDKFAEERLSVDVHPKEEDDSAMMELDSKTQMDNNVAEEIKSDVVLDQEEEDVDICGADSDSSSSSDSDGSSSGSDSDSESDSDEGVDDPAVRVVLPEENGTSAQPPPVPAPEAVKSTKPDSVSDDGVDSTAPPPALLPEANVVKPSQSPSHRASEVVQRAEPKKVQGVQRAAPKAVCFPGLMFRAKVRRELLEMERAVLPDESIHARDLRRLCIAEYGRPSVMRQLGLVLKADA